MRKLTLILCLVACSVCNASLQDTKITAGSDHTLKITYPKDKEIAGIILVGDTGNDNKYKDQVAQAITTYCHTTVCTYALLLGDNFYQTGVDSIEDSQFKTKFEQSYQNLDFVFFPVLGNHDALGNWEAEIQYHSQHWIMGGRYYEIQSKLVNIFALDTNVFVKSNEAATNNQLTWLQNQLSNSKTNWKIVYGHHPVFSSGSHGNTKSLEQHILPLLQKYKVDFYISGHDHDLELIEASGIKFVISGAGSALRSISPGDNSVFAKSTLGFAHLLINKNTATLTFVDSNANIEFERKYTH